MAAYFKMNRKNSGLQHQGATGLPLLSTSNTS